MLGYVLGSFWKLVLDLYHQQQIALYLRTRRKSYAEIVSGQPAHREKNLSTRMLGQQIFQSALHMLTTVESHH